MKKQIAVLCAVSVLLVSAAGCSINLSSDLVDLNNSDSSSESVSSAESSESESLSNSKQDTSDNKSLYVTGTNETVAMRETDEDNATVVGQLSMGDEVKLLSSDSVSYYCVLQESTGKQGYVKKAYLTEEKSAVCKGEECFASKQTSLYDTKDSDHKELQKINSGTSVTVLAKTSGDYWFVNLTGSKTYGYVKCMDLSSTKPAASSNTASKASTASSAKPSANTNKPAQQNSYYTGPSSGAPANYSLYYAKVNTGYLAIRSAKAFDSSNELGRMYTGDSVYVVDKSTGTYWYCYSPTTGIYGYVNSDYLVTSNPGYTTANDYSVWSVKVNSGYLALRSAPAYNSANEIGKLYTGNTVYVYSYSYANFSDTYWYVYSPSLGMWGYVDSNYIYS